MSPGSDRAFGMVIGGSGADSKAAETPGDEYFRTIVEATPDCVQIVSPAGILLFANTQGLALIGASSAEAIVGKSIFDFIAPEDRERFRDMNDRICRGEGK